MEQLCQDARRCCPAPRSRRVLAGADRKANGWLAGPDGYRRRTAGTWYAANTGHGQGVHAVDLVPGRSGLSPSVAVLPGRPGSRDAGSAL